MFLLQSWILYWTESRAVGRHDNRVIDTTVARNDGKIDTIYLTFFLLRFLEVTS